MTRDPRTARLALLAHPLVGQWGLSGDLLRRLAEAEASRIPLPARRSEAKPSRGAVEPPNSGGCPPMSDAIAIAVDGGNSKTDLALVRGDGTVLAVVRGPSSSPQRIGLGGAVEVLDGLLSEATAAAGLAADDGAIADVARILLAGADLPVEERALQEAVAERGWSRSITVANDTFGVLRAGTDRGWGVAIVCGAGLNCVGVAPDGREARFPALGLITGDWGGGRTSASPGSRRRPGAPTGAGERTSLERAVPAYSASRRRRSSPRPCTSAGSPTRG